MRNTLYYGDNLDVMRRHLKDESVDLVYLDPPFNSNQDYNVLFKGKDGTDAAAQIKAFEDTWTWDRNTRLQYEELSAAGGAVGKLMDAFLDFLQTSDMMAYLTMMAPRLVELRRVMKPTASIYLHCDPTASHYLKLLMDAVFGPQNFRNEVIWKRSSAHTAKKFAPVHDVLLFYTKDEQWTWNPSFQPLPQETIDQWYNNVEDGTGRKYNRADLTAAGTRTGSSGAAWRGIDPTAKGRHWAIPGFAREACGIEDGMDSLQALDLLDKAGRLHWPKKEGGMPMFKRYLDEAKGIPLLDVISDITPLNNVDAERLGYPTQKPEALLERIINASSPAGGLVLDPFCGCGTAVAVAQRLNRKWIGIDITHLAISLMKHRLSGFEGVEYAVVGEPKTLEDAIVLAADDPYQFQWWSLGLVGARPVEEKKGADKGIDGRKRFFEHGKSGSKAREVIFSVKAGQKIPAHAVRDLRGTIEREKVDFGVLISLADATNNMRDDADAAGFIVTHGYEGERKYPRLQCVTVKDLLDGKKLDLPPFAFAGGDQTLKSAPVREVESKKKGPKQASLGASA
ncbi:MAG TPA: DNA methyltransferase [Candidatus Thermoplasmatota archaeon]|nr:DNA methyltransferase [Candidatus Thermoplasmatota archaeon]